jgi:membrane protein
MTDIEKKNTQENSSGEAGFIRQWAFRFRPGESRLSATLRSWLRVILIMLHEFSETAISLRASALTYTIVLSMVPMLAMSTAVLKGLGSDNQLKVAAYKFIDQLEPEQLPAKGEAGVETGQPQPVMKTSEPAGMENPPPQENPATRDPASEPKNSESLTTHLRSAVDTIFDYVDQTNFAAIGAFGILGLLLTVILVLSTIEDAMNAIWHSKKGRSVFRKIMDYLALLILLPVSINVALAGDAIIESPAIMAYLGTVIPSAWAVKMLLKFLPFLFVILSLMVMYLFFPNVKVKTSSAFIGAVFAGFFWLLVQKVYILLQIGVAKYNAIYGSFATVPLFLIWVQLGWTFILLGASLAYAVQNRNQYHLPGAAVSPQRNLQMAFDILNTIYANYSRKKQTSFDDLVETNTGDLPGDIQEITEKLARGGLVRRIDDNNRSYVPAAPSEAVDPREVVRLILGREDIPTVGGELSGKVIRAAENAIPPEAFPVPEKVPEENKGGASVETDEKAS